LRANLQTAFSELQQLLLEQFDLDTPADQKIRALGSYRTRLRRFKSDIATKYLVVFEKSSQNSAISKAQHEECFRIANDILTEVTDLPRQSKAAQAIGDELKKAENKLVSLFPPRSVQFQPLDEAVRPRPPECAKIKPLVFSETGDLSGPFQELSLLLSDSEDSEDRSPAPVPHKAVLPHDQTPRSPPAQPPRTGCELEQCRQELVRVQDDYETVVVQLEVAYEEQKELTAKVDDLTAALSSKTEENEALLKQLRHLQELLLDTPSECQAAEFRSAGDFAEDSEDRDALKQKIRLLQRDQESLHANIEKLTAENRQLRAQLSASPADTPLFSQISVFEETEQLLKEELSRVYALLDHGADFALVDTVRLHQEKAALIMRLDEAERDLSFFRDLRAHGGCIQKVSPHRAAVYEHAEMLRRIAHEQENARKLAAEVRELRLLSRGWQAEAGQRRLLQERLAHQRIRLDLHRMAARVVSLKSRLRAVSVGELGEQAQALEEQAATMRAAYKAAVEWGYEQQAALFAEQARVAILEMEIAAVRKENPKLTVEERVLVAVRERVAKQVALEADYRWLQEAVAELHREVIGEALEEGCEPAEMVNRLRQALHRR
jgi:hypothetical protein